MRKQPEKFNFSMVRDALAATQPQGDAMLFNEDFGLLQGDDSQLFHYMQGRNVPLLIDDYRFGLLLEGEVCSSINLMEHRIGPGTLVYIGPGTIVNPLRISPNVRVKGLALFRDLPVMAGRRPALFSGAVRHFLLPLTPEQQQVVEQLVDTLWLVARSEPFSRPTFDALVGALMQQYDHLFQLHETQQARPSHAADIFNRFIQLVNTHARRQHQLGFYADRLCLTQRHLGTVVRQVSGVTAKEWIDRAIMTEAKVLLKHSNQSIAEISDALNFPNPSFFSKFFHRREGLTAGEYRRD